MPLLRLLPPRLADPLAGARKNCPYKAFTVCQSILHRDGSFLVLQGLAAARASNQTRVSAPQGAAYAPKRRILKGLGLMDIAHPGALWLLPVLLSVTFLVWVFWGFRRDQRR
jgi:hypothetical protein